MSSFMDRIQETGHSAKEVVALLEGARPIPSHVLTVPVPLERYRIDTEMTRRWELVTDQYGDLKELMQAHHRDLGPYVHLRLDQPEQWAEHLKSQPREAWCLVNPDIVKKAAKGYVIEDEDSDDDEEDDTFEELKDPGAPRDVSDSFGLRLVEWPEELGAGASCTASTFVRFFSEEGYLVSRFHLQGLPKLPWLFGSDERNTIIMDIPGTGTGIAPFHCIFQRSNVQPLRACIVPLGDPMAQSYIICPKYQPLQVQNGDRLVCHEWMFQLRIEPTENAHVSALSLLTDEGVVYKVPFEGCHVGAGNRSRQLENQPTFPSAKFALTHRLKDMAAVHLAFHFSPPMNRWTLVDHSPNPLGALLLLQPGVAYPLSEGLRVKLGPVVLEVADTQRSPSKRASKSA